MNATHSNNSTIPGAKRHLNIQHSQTAAVTHLPSDNRLVLPDRGNDNSLLSTVPSLPIPRWNCEKRFRRDFRYVLGHRHA